MGVVFSQLPRGSFFMVKTLSKKINNRSKDKMIDECYNAIYLLLKLINDWGNLINVILKPFSIILIILSIISIYLTQNQEGDIRLIFEIISGLITAFAGGIVSYYFFEYMGNTLVIKKSIGAIRNLQLLKAKIENISERISFLGSDKSGEVSNLVNNIHKDILNSISDWGDVNPNAEYITDYYEMITLAKREVAVLKKDVKDLEEQKDEITDIKGQKINALSGEIDRKNKEISRLNDKLFEFQQNVGTITASGASGYGYGGGGLVLSRVCKNCGRMFTPYPTLSGVMLCSFCGASN